MVLAQPSSKPNDNGGRKRGRHAEVLRAPRILIVDDDEADAGRIATALRNPASKIGQLDCEISWVKDVFKRP